MEYGLCGICNQSYLLCNILVVLSPKQPQQIISNLERDTLHTDTIYTHSDHRHPHPHRHRGLRFCIYFISLCPKDFYVDNCEYCLNVCHIKYITMFHCIFASIHGLSSERAHITCDRIYPVHVRNIVSRKLYLRINKYLHNTSRSNISFQFNHLVIRLIPAFRLTLTFGSILGIFSSKI